MLMPWLKLVWNFIQKIPPWEIWHITLQFQIKILQFCAYFWLKFVWNFSQKIPPWEISHIPYQFQIRISRFCVYCELKFCMKFHSKDTSLRIMIQTTSIPNPNLSIRCLFWPEIENEILFKRDLLEKYDT